MLYSAHLLHSRTSIITYKFLQRLQLLGPHTEAPHLLVSDHSSPYAQLIHIDRTEKKPNKTLPKLTISTQRNYIVRMTKSKEIAQGRTEASVATMCHSRSDD